MFHTTEPTLTRFSWEKNDDSALGTHPDDCQVKGQSHPRHSVGVIIPLGVPRMGGSPNSWMVCKRSEHQMDDAWTLPPMERRPKMGHKMGVGSSRSVQMTLSQVFYSKVIIESGRVVMAKWEIPKSTKSFSSDG